MINKTEEFYSKKGLSYLSSKSNAGVLVTSKVTRNKSIIFLLVAMLPLLAACGDKNEPAQSINRVAEVREKGSEVMPFDLDKTLHTFEKTSYGGFQIVSIRGLGNSDELNPIREHLKKIATDFENGNFGDPVSIHGSQMPGLSTLQANSSKFSINYIEQVNGAKLEYHSTDDMIISALHLWFDAQLTDHGTDATSSTSENFSGFSKDHICQMHPETCKNNTP
jgi:hypothetical protein